jgi:AcrR family transcriptional regulator
MSRIERPPGPDRRVRRTRDRLGEALVELIQEKRFDDISVREVSRKAGVGRSTFYAHFPDKEALFLAEIDDGLRAMASSLSRAREPSDRVAPVRELFSHVAEMRDLRRAFAASDRLHVYLDRARMHFAWGIERRLGEVPSGRWIAPTSHALAAHAHAGALVSLLMWWLGHPKPASPGDMDRAFHRMFWEGLRPRQRGGPGCP